MVIQYLSDKTRVCGDVRLYTRKDLIRFLKSVFILSIKKKF